MESYVERWKREQAEKGEKLQLSSLYGEIGQKPKKPRKKVNEDARAEEAQGQTKGKRGYETP